MLHGVVFTEFAAWGCGAEDVNLLHRPNSPLMSVMFASKGLKRMDVRSFFRVGVFEGLLFTRLADVRRTLWRPRGKASHV